MKNYLNKSTFKGIKSELAEKYGGDKSDEIWKYADSEYHKLETADRIRNCSEKFHMYDLIRE